MKIGKLTFTRYDAALFMCYGMYAACSVVIPIVLKELADALNFPLDEGGMGAGGAIQLGRSIPMVGAMLLCGFAAGKWGKMNVLGTSLLFMSCGIMAASWSPTYAILLCAVILSGLGEGVIEGLATPVIQDLHKDEPGRYINFTHSFWSVGIVLTVLLVGYMLVQGVSWRVIVLICGILTLVPAAMVLWPSRRKYKIDKGSLLHWHDVACNAVELMKLPRFWLFFTAMFFVGGYEYCLTFWVASYVRLEYASSAMMGGIATACFSAGMILGRMGFGILVKQNHLKHLIVYATLAGTAVSLFIPMLHGSLALLFLFFFIVGICIAPGWPSVQSHCTHRVKGDHTMILILLSCAGVPGCGFFAWIMGVLGDNIGLRNSLYIVPVCMLLTAGLMIYDWHASRKDETIQ